MQRLKTRFAAFIAAVLLACGSLGAFVASSVTAPTAATAVGALGAVAALTATQDAAAAALTDYTENKIIDWLFRGQAFSPPATLYVGLATSACSDSSAGTEVTGGSYARVAVTGSLANWAGTQSAGSTTASTGTGGTTSNNAVLTFPSPTANWGSVTHAPIFDASTSGNTIFCIQLTVAKTVNNGDAAPSFAAAALSLQIDN
jgi:hypothetical protein